MGLKTAYYIICNICGKKNIDNNGIICYSNTVKGAYDDAVERGWQKKEKGEIKCKKCKK